MKVAPAVVISTGLTMFHSEFLWWNIINAATEMDRLAFVYLLSNKPLELGLDLLFVALTDTDLFTFSFVPLCTNNQALFELRKWKR